MYSAISRASGYLLPVHVTRSMASGFHTTPAKASVASPDFLKPIIPVALASPALKSEEIKDLVSTPSQHSVTRVSVADDPLSMFAAPSAPT